MGEKLYAKITSFQLRSLHTMPIFPCTPIVKNAKKYSLQSCPGDLVLIYHVCGLDRQAL